ncbi:MAG: hypothetical protein ACE5D8_02230 [Fidelibacterota bacterium]
MIPVILIGVIYLWISSKTAPTPTVFPLVQAPESLSTAVMDSTSDDSLESPSVSAKDTVKSKPSEPKPLLAKVMTKQSEPVKEEKKAPTVTPVKKEEKKEEQKQKPLQRPSPPPVPKQVSVPQVTPPDTTPVVVKTDTLETVTQNRDSLLVMIDDPALLFKMKEYERAAQRWDAEKKQSYSRFTIVLMYACSPATIDTVLNIIPDPEELFILPKTIEEQGCYIICWGDFETRQMADAQYLSLPPWFAEHGLSPMVRPFFKIDQLTRLTMTRLIMNQPSH